MKQVINIGKIKVTDVTKLNKMSILSLLNDETLDLVGNSYLFGAGDQVLVDVFEILDGKISKGKIDTNNLKGTPKFKLVDYDEDTHYIETNDNLVSKVRKIKYKKWSKMILPNLVIYIPSDLKELVIPYDSKTPIYKLQTLNWVDVIKMFIYWKKIIYILECFLWLLQINKLAFGQEQKIKDFLDKQTYKDLKKLSNYPDLTEFKRRNTLHIGGNKYNRFHCLISNLIR